MSAGREKLMILALAANELGITAMLPWEVCKRVARQSISVTRPSVPSMEIQSPSWYGLVVLSTIPENTSLRVLCNARPTMIATAPEVASTPLTGRSST